MLISHIKVSWNLVYPFNVKMQVVANSVFLLYYFHHFYHIHAHQPQVSSQPRAPESLRYRAFLRLPDSICLLLQNEKSWAFIFPLGLGVAVKQWLWRAGYKYYNSLASDWDNSQIWAILSPELPWDFVHVSLF